MKTNDFIITETNFIQQLVRDFSRSPLQVNTLQGADAEFVSIPGDINRVLAITIDSLVEEISSGLYSDPAMIGWMAVTASLSDLAAVGAVPIGMLVSQVFPENYSVCSTEQLQSGMRRALSNAGTFLLGGDTNFGASLLVTGCAVGIVEGRVISRVGAAAGDVLYCSGALGCGNAFAVATFCNNADSIGYQPRPRINEGSIVRRYANCCMDSSDGVIATLDQLCRLNGVGFSIDVEAGSLLDPASERLALAAGIPSWLLLAGQHGEFELIFSIPREQESEFLEAASSIGWQPVRMGTVTKNNHIAVNIEGTPTIIDSGYLRNLATHQSVGAGRRGAEFYIEALIAYSRELKKGASSYADKHFV